MPKNKKKLNLKPIENLIGNYIISYSSDDRPIPPVLVGKLIEVNRLPDNDPSAIRGKKFYIKLEYPWELKRIRKLNTTSTLEEQTFKFIQNPILEKGYTPISICSLDETDNILESKLKTYRKSYQGLDIPHFEVFKIVKISNDFMDKFMRDIELYDRHADSPFSYEVDLLKAQIKSKENYERKGFLDIITSWFKH